jgi:hypothetical protein
VKTIQHLPNGYSIVSHKGCVMLASPNGGPCSGNSLAWHIIQNKQRRHGFPFDFERGHKLYVELTSQRRGTKDVKSTSSGLRYFYLLLTLREQIKQTENQRQILFDMLNSIPTSPSMKMEDIQLMTGLLSTLVPLLNELNDYLKQVGNQSSTLKQETPR